MSRVANKRAAKVEAIYDVAAALFAERGFAATRMEDIARGVGMQKASIYYYFESKELLLTSLVQKRVGFALQALEEISIQPGTATERLRSAIVSHLSVFQRHSDIYTIYDSERFHSISVDVAEKVDSLSRDYERLWSSLIEEGMVAGEFRSDLDVTVTMKAMIGACNATLSWYSPDGRLTVEDLGEAFSNLFLAGMAV